MIEDGNEVTRILLLRNWPHAVRSQTVCKTEKNEHLLILFSSLSIPQSRLPKNHPKK